MTAALIVIEVPAPSVSDDALAVLVSSCSRAARGAECVLAKNSADERPAAVAIVSFQGADKVHVEVGIRRGEHDTWRTKDFAFLAADEERERFRAVGFAIGTLAENDAEPIADPAPIPPPPPPNASPLPRPSTPRPVPKPAASSRVFVSAVGLIGQGLDRGPWRIGSELGVALAPARLPLYFMLHGSAATRFSRDELGVTARWFDVSAGAGIPLLGALGHSGLELGASFLLERFDASVSTIDGRSDSLARWLFGVEVALGGRVEVAPDLFLTADLRGAGLSAETEVQVTGNITPDGGGHAQSFRYLGSFGLRVRLH